MPMAAEALAWRLSRFPSSGCLHLMIPDSVEPDNEDVDSSPQAYPETRPELALLSRKAGSPMRMGSPGF